MTIQIKGGSTSRQISVAASLNVRPMLALHDQPNIAQVDAVLCPQLRQGNPTGLVPAADCTNVGLGERGVVVGLARVSLPWGTTITSRAATLRRSIGRVVCVASDPKMRRIAAQWIVAAVTNTRTGRDWAVGKLPRDTMGSLRVAVPHRALAISPGRPRPRPRPTSARPARLINPGPKYGDALLWGILLARHWRLRSGGPVGVGSTATGNLFVGNYSIETGAMP